MIKTLLKHTIAETAINTFFGKVTDNFMSIYIGKFKIGQTYTTIINEYHYSGISYRCTHWKCEIVDVNDNGELLVNYNMGAVTQKKDGYLVETYGLTGNRTIVNIKDIKWAII